MKIPKNRKKKMSPVMGKAKNSSLGIKDTLNIMALAKIVSDVNKA